MVFQKEKLKPASESLGLKLSTAKFIVKCFKKEGRIFKKHGSYLQLTEDEQKMLAGINTASTEIPPSQPPNVMCPVFVYVPYIAYPSVHTQSQPLPYTSCMGF